MPTNDNELPVPGAEPPSSEAHGMAALLLVESLIHGLCEKTFLSAGDAVEIAERAMHVQSEQAEAAGGSAGPAWQSHMLLSSIAVSLGIDHKDGPPPVQAI